jgi:predicted ribosome quality control (RQC) complex YloA/Tae2 family protein
MHLNYHFLKFLCPELERIFLGKTIEACFSQSKDELIIGTSDRNETRWIRAHLLPPQKFLSFPEQFHRAKRNSINLFPELIGDQIQACKVFEFERAFYFLFSSGKKLVFKLHGNRSNILLYPDGEDFPNLLFRNAVREDKELSFQSLSVNLDLSENNFRELDGNASKFLPTLGSIPRAWLKEKGYPDASIEDKWNMMQDLLDILDSPLYSLIEKEEGINLSLLPENNPIKTFSSPTEAVNELFYLALVKGTLEKERNTILKSLQDNLKRTESYLEKSSEKLHLLKTSPPPSQLADVIMANLHLFNASDTEVELMDFYTGNTIKVKLKPNQKPQDLAENLYRKSKNRQMEIDQIQKTLDAKKELRLKILDEIQNVTAIEGFKSLKAFQKNQQKEDSSANKNSGLPFKIFEFEGYTIWVGKSAKDNDEMLRGFIHKDDLWLHARQVPGSHVVIRTKGMPKIPSNVLERAAELAAYYSKLKSDSLAPVIYTEVKFVRKIKGSPSGSVQVDREKVVMVRPNGPDEHTAIGN